MSDLADLRREYARAELSREHVAEDPIEQFQSWFQDAIDAELREPNAMTLATATSDGSPSARIVLLKGVDARGFRFFTNYKSRKGTELANNPHTALVFWWAPLERQVRIEGRADRLPSNESEEYFQSRPRESQIGAWASPQSQVVNDRDEIEEAFNRAKESYEGDSVPRPGHWGGYVVRPTSIEFWQGRPSRLHDRLRYRRSEVDAQDWTLDRLAP